MRVVGRIRESESLHITDGSLGMEFTDCLFERMAIGNPRVPPAFSASLPCVSIRIYHTVHTLLYEYDQSLGPGLSLQR